MGVTDCGTHGHVLVGLSCEHVAKNILKGKNEKCIVVKLRIYPGENAENWEKEVSYEIPFCIKCFEDKQLTRKMKIESQEVPLLAKMGYEIGYSCARCLTEYVQKNII